MADRWFNVPEVEAPDGEGYQPAYAGRVDGYSAFVIGSSPRYVVRFYADEATLDGIADESDTTELAESEATNMFNNAHGKDWSPSRVDNSFWVSN